MNYFFNDRNLLSDAVVSALNVVSSSAIYRTDDDPKTGSGVVSLTGPYTGQHDSTFDVEILDGTGDSSQVSQPVFTGVGNGTMSDVSVTGLDAQVFTIRLVDPGTQTLTATAVFQGVTLKAAASGDDGNDLSISVDTSAIVRTPKGAALLEDLRAGTNAYTGSQWDFGAKALVNGGTDIPDDAPRIAFGIDPQVYRAYKVFDASAGQYVYSFSPPPVRDVEAGSQVYDVTGAYDISVTDGSTTEDYPTCTTLYDLMTALSASSLIDPDSAIAYNDHKPNGQAVNDISVLTQSHVLSIEKDGSRAVMQADIGITVAEAAPQERLSIRCTSNAIVGAEVWEVSGDVSGAHANATTGEAYSDGAYAFTIPVQLPPPEAPGGDIVVGFQPVGRPADGDSAPIMCVKRALLGAQAHNATYRFVWTRKPKPCVCIDDLNDLVNYDCLGLEAEGGGSVPASIIALRKQRLVTAVRTFIESNTDAPEKVDSGDVEWINTSARIFSDALGKLAGDGAVLTYAARESSHAYEEGTIIFVGDYRYICSQAGTSASSAPSYSTTIDAEVTDGTAKFINLGKLPLIAFDDAFDAWETDAGSLDGQENPQNIPAWQPDTNYEQGAYVVPTQQNGFYYISIPRISDPNDPEALGTSGPIEPIWPTTEDDTVLDSPLGGSTSSDDVSQGVKWECHALSDVSVQKGVSDSFYERYRAQMRDVLFAAGIDDSNFESASTAGSPCWQEDTTQDHWFVSADGLKPMQLHHPYYSCRDGVDEDGRPIVIPTNEFGVWLEWGCPERLQEGDVVEVDLSNISGGAGTYQVDDTFSISIAHADPVPFGGGQPGDDTLTWAVSGSLDGPFADYALVTTALAAYSDGGLAFTITPGGIPFQLGDTFTFAAVGGHFQWRQNGGSWSSSTVIGTTTLADGVSANFTGGASDPSWATGDTFSFKALAINGIDQATSPTDGRLTWTGSTTISVTPTSSVPVSRLSLWDHTIPSDAAIRLQGSDDNFATTPTDISVTWTERHILAVFDSVTRAKWRITIDKGGSIFWAFLGAQMQPMNPRSIRDVGIFTKRRRVPGLGVRSALAGEIKHEVVSQTSFEDFMDGLDYACANDDGTFGVVINEGLSEMMLVRFTGTEVEVTDLLDYQPLDAVKNRVQAFTLPVAALP
jgi:hypothetical protein